MSLIPATGIPATGIPATGIPATGIPATGIPATGIPATGIPATGIPATGIPATGIPATEDEPEQEGRAPTARWSDPFLDSSIGADVWTKVAPRGSQYWVVVFALAITLSLFSWYWRSSWLPSQPLDWPLATEFTLQQAISLRRPVLVWVEAGPLEALREPAGQEMAVSELAAAITGLDVEPVRVRLRMKSAFLAKVDLHSNPAIHRLLGWEPSRDSNGLLLWHPHIGPPKLLTPPEISPEQIITWLNGNGR